MHRCNPLWRQSCLGQLTFTVRCVLLWCLSETGFLSKGSAAWSCLAYAPTSSVFYLAFLRWVLFLITRVQRLGITALFPKYMKFFGNFRATPGIEGKEKEDANIEGFYWLAKPWAGVFRCWNMRYFHKAVSSLKNWLFKWITNPIFAITLGWD